MDEDGDAACPEGEVRAGGWITRGDAVSTWVILGVSVLLAVVIVGGVWRLVRSKKTALSQLNLSYQREKVRAGAAQSRADAYQRTADRMIGVAENAVTQTGQALDVAQEIKKVSVQMDSLMYRVAGEVPEASRWPLARSTGAARGRHTLRRDLDDELGFGNDTEQRYIP